MALSLPVLANAESRTEDVGGRRSTVSIKSFGVRGDGVTDDSVAVQKAIDSLRAGDTLVFSGVILLNRQISVTTDGVSLNFSDATVLNTSAIGKTNWERQGINPVFLINASNVKCSGGLFKGFVSQGFFAGGKFAGKGAKGNTRSGVSFKKMRFSGLVSRVESKCIQTRHVDDVVIENIVAENIGMSRADHYCETLSVNYCVNARISDSTVQNMKEGGAVNYLYVDQGVIQQNKFLNMGNASYSIPLALHVKHSNEVSISDNEITMIGGGVSMKISEYSDNVQITGNKIRVSGPQPKMFAGVYFQGASNFNFSRNSLTYGGGRAIFIGPHKKVNSRNGTIKDNIIATRYSTGDAKVKGSGIQVVGGNIGSDRGPMEITKNTFYDADVYLFQTPDTVVSGNRLMSRTAPAAVERTYGGRNVYRASSSILVENGDRTKVTGNKIANDDTSSDGTMVGIRLLASPNCEVTGNSVTFSPNSRSYGVFIEKSSNTMLRNSVVNGKRSNVER